MCDLSNKKVLMIVAHRNFRDEEFEIPFNYLSARSADITVSSTDTGFAKGAFGTKVVIKKSLENIDETKFNAVIFVGGKGTVDVRNNKRAIEIAKNFKGDVTAAICWAPTILAKAGVLKNKKATVWLGSDAEYNKTTDEVLKSYGAVFVKNSVVEDGNIVTGNGYLAAEEFAKVIADKLNKKR
jgi:protease I